MQCHHSAEGRETKYIFQFSTVIIFIEGRKLYNETQWGIHGRIPFWVRLCMNRLYSIHDLMQHHNSCLTKVLNITTPVRFTATLDSFKSKLKTYYFEKSYL